MVVLSVRGSGPVCIPDLLAAAAAAASVWEGGLLSAIPHSADELAEAPPDHRPEGVGVGRGGVSATARWGTRGWVQSALFKEMAEGIGFCRGSECLRY